MRLTVRVKPGAHRDSLWRDGDGLFAQIRATASGGEANDYLVQYIAGCLRVAKSLVTIVRGQTSSHKLINVKASAADLRPMLEALPRLPQTTLFDE